MKCVRCRRCFFFSDPSSGEPPGSETEAFSESGDQNEAGHRALGPVRILWLLGPQAIPQQFLSLWLALTQVVTLDSTHIKAKLFSPPPPEGGALTTVLRAFTSMFWKRRMWSARI